MAGMEPAEATATGIEQEMPLGEIEAEGSAVEGEEPETGRNSDVHGDLILEDMPAPVDMND
jgi:hypothetical protein